MYIWFFIKPYIHWINLYIINHFLLNINSFPEVIKNVKKKITEATQCLFKFLMRFKSLSTQWKTLTSCSQSFRSISDSQAVFLDPIITLHGYWSMKGKKPWIEGTCFILMITRQVKVRHKHEITEIAEIVVHTNRYQTQLLVI